MVTVPRVSQDRVKQTAPPRARISTSAPIESFGGGVSVERKAQATRGLISSVSDLVLQQKQRADNIKTRDANSKLTAWKNDYLNNPKTGILNTRGENSLTLPENFDAAFNKANEEIGGGLTNRSQRVSYGVGAEKTRLDMQNQINVHVSNETETYDSQVTESSLANESISAINNFDNPLRIEESIEEQKRIIKQHAKDNGLSPETEKAMEFKALSKTHIGVINNLVSFDSNLAKAYFKENKKEINQAILNKADLNSAIDKAKNASILNQKFVKIDNQNKFNETIQDRSLADNLEELNNGLSIGKYNSNWSKARKQEILSARGIDAEIQYEHEMTIINSISDLEANYSVTEKEKKKKGRFQEKSSDFLRKINEIDIEISNGITNGLLDLQDAQRLRKSLYSKKLSTATQAVSEQDSWFGYDMKKATEAFELSLPASRVSFAVREYFKQTDGKSIKTDDKKNIVENIMNTMRERDRKFAFDETDKINTSAIIPEVQDTAQAFNSFQEAKDANLKKGTLVIINGKRFEAP